MKVIYTPKGLKIRLDPVRVEKVLEPASGKIDIADAYRDLELWADFPNAFSTTCTIITAVLTHSLLWTFLVFISSYGMANIFQQITYSRILNLLFPTFLGVWIIALPSAVAAFLYLYFSGSLLVGLVQLGIIIANWLHYTDVMLFIFTPIRIAIRKITRINLGDVEIAFIQILSLQAQRAGIQLDWDIYNRH